jgi:selenide,water dikinase
MSEVPLIRDVRELAAQGLFTGASGRNWAAYGASVNMDASLDDVDRALLTDPQTSGGLLVACAPDAVERVLEIFRRDGFEQAAVVGDLAAGEPVVNVRP